jgi:hypothetical protein
VSPDVDIIVGSVAPLPEKVDDEEVKDTSVEDKDKDSVSLDSQHKILYRDFIMK